MGKGKRVAASTAVAIAVSMASQPAWAADTRLTEPPAVPSLGTTVASPEAFIETLFGHPIGWIIKATGDLNGDGREDWAGVMQWDTDTTNNAQLFILLRSADGGYVFAERSLASDTYRSGVEDLTIGERGMLTLNYSNSCAADCHASINLHYKLFKGAWTLVGSDELSFNTSTQEEHRYSTNFLTGRKVTDVIGPHGKVVSSTVGHSDTKPVTLHDAKLFGR